MIRHFTRSTGRLAPLVAFVLGCGKGAESTTRPLFKLLSSSETGITFANTIPTSDSVNVLTNVYLYNGGGVGVGDIDNDGLPDIFFTGNMVSSRLYLNRGNMRFEDITQSAGVTTSRWASGVSLVDINSDGFLDIYLSMSGPPWATPEDTRNLLFINNRNRTFTESAKAYGIDDPGFTAHAVFLDYDGDRDLDLFLLGNSPQDFARSQLELHPAGIRRQTSAGQDRLYRNNGNATFTDVSREAGISAEAQFGLGVVVNDFNRDGWPDLYLSNDDLADDVLYINNRNGTFTDKSHTWLKHTSFAGMGIDAADFDNDGWPDVMQTDMMPDDLPTRKRMSGAVSRSDQMERRRRGYLQAYTQNTLQLSNGVTSTGDLVFSEIARMAGVAYTHWSWAALFADCDNDGFKDLLVTSGYPKAVTDFDYQTKMFKLLQTEADPEKISPQRLKILQDLPSYRVSNYIFRNNGDLTFTKTTRAWGLDQPGFSYGAAFADLDTNGTLDLVVSHIDAPASVYQNVGPVGGVGGGDARHYIDVELRGDVPNTHGIGATLMLVAGGEHQYIYHTPYHGYLSSMDHRAHFGLGTAARVDSLVITWPDGRLQTFTDLTVDTVIIAKQADATRPSPSREARLARPFAPAEAPLFAQRDLGFVDFSIQSLLPEQVSKLGPPLAVGDANGDGLDDLFVGGVPGTPGKLFVQHPDGRLTESSQEQPWARDRGYQDWGAVFFDANGDGRLDLYVASGGYHFSPISAFLQDRLYINRGGGRFQRDSAALPQMLTATAAVAAGDFNGDGKTDLFVGGRLTPRNYPYPTRSYILRNDGGRFTDVTEHVAPELVTPGGGGMITAALWIDFDGDGQLDLVTAGDWMPLQFFKKEGQHLRNVTESMGIGPTRGRWLSLASGDFNRDGHPDLVAGNLGQNHTYRTSRESRFGIYAGDYTGVRRTDIILTTELDGTEYPWYGLAMLGKPVYTIGVRFPNHAAFSHASIRDILSASQIAGSLHYQADTFASLYLQRTGQGTFTATPLPSAAQIAPVRGIVVTDVDRDGYLDLLVAGNLYDTEPNTAPADAGNGLWLRGDGGGHFTAVSPRESGFLTPGNVTGLSAMKTPTGTAVLVASHGDSLSAYVVRRR